MDLKKINSLTELFFYQYEKQKDKNKTFLSTLKEPRKDYSWQETFNLINKLSKEIKKYVNKGDRCLLISENRPEWFITDLSVMLSEAIVAIKAILNHSALFAIVIGIINTSGGIGNIKLSINEKKLKKNFDLL